MCANSMNPFYLTVSGLLACGGWKKRYQGCCYYHCLGSYSGTYFMV